MYPDGLCWSSGCICGSRPDVMLYECCVPLLKVVRIGEARHVYSWGNPDEVNPDENACHVSSGDVCHMWGGVPTILTNLFFISGEIQSNSFH